LTILIQESIIWIEVVQDSIASYDDKFN
jgi:hypothetical protein